MPTAPTPITPLPTAPSRADPANFPARADAFLTALGTFGSQLNANASAAFGNASEAATAANNAAASQTSAVASATAAAASAVTAVNAPGTSGTSTTSLTIGTGSKTFTTQTGKAWVVGQFVTVASTASPTNFMYGQITAYNSGTGSMTVSVLSVGGSGTLASWTIGLGGPNSTLTDQNSLQPVTLTLPSIRPSLLLDFANSKKLDPRITFSRATSGTYYDGVTTAKAEENLLLRSQDFSTTWTLANLTAGSSVTAPDATATGSSFTASAANGTLTQSGTAVAGDHTFSVWLRRVSGTGNIDISAHSGGTWVTQTITSSWARYTVTQTLTAGARTPGIRIVTSGDQIEVWGAQLERRSAATAYTPTTTQPITRSIPALLTAPAGVPRFDHNPVTGESLGLLVEEQRTNLALYSQQFDDAYWTKDSTTITTNATVAPDGTLTAEKLIVNAAAAGGDVNRNTIAATSTVTYTFSVYLKSDGIAGWAQIVLQGTSFPGAVSTAWFNLSSGQAGTNNGFVSASIANVGNGWYRIAVTAAAFSNLRPYIAPATGDNINGYTGDGYSGIFIWGAQLEAGAVPTSYIPTTSAAVTRNIDIAFINTANLRPWFNTGEFSVAIRYSCSLSGWYIPVMEFNGSTNFAAVLALQGFNNNGWNPYLNNLGNGGFSPTFSGPFSGSQSIAAAASTTEFVFAQNGAITHSNTSVTGPFLDVQQIRIFHGINATVTPIANVGTVSRISFYPKRLTNAQLQALTA